MFVARIMDWYLEEVQEGLKSNDWTKANEVAGMIGTYQQAKNKTLDISPKKIQSELKYNKMDVFRYCKIGYLILGGLLLIFTFIVQFQQKRWIKSIVWILGILVLIVFHYHMYGILVDMPLGAIHTKQWYMWPGLLSLPVCCLYAAIQLL